MKRKLEEIFAQRNYEEWCATLEGTDACFVPVLTLSEVPGHHHMAPRAKYPRYRSCTATGVSAALFKNAIQADRWSICQGLAGLACEMIQRRLTSRVADGDNITQK